MELKKVADDVDLTNCELTQCLLLDQLLLNVLKQ